MNLFISAWNWPGMSPASVVAEMQRMNQIYPQLGADTLCGESDPSQRLNV